MMTKGELVQGAYQFLKVSGIASTPTGDELAMGVQVADDLFAQLSIDLDTGYYQPVQYGESSLADEAGLIPEFAGAAKKILALELHNTFYDGDAPPMLQRIANQGMQALQQAIVHLDDTVLPATLPQGSGNDYLDTDTTFFGGATPKGTVYVSKGDAIALDYDWSYWTQDDATVVSVTYEASTGLSLVDQGVTDDMSSVKITFEQEGLKSICIRAVSSAGGSKTVKKYYYVKECEVI